MVEVIKNKKVLYREAVGIAELCVQTTWRAKDARIKTPLGMFSGLYTSDKKCVDGYKKQGVKFSETKGYFVRIMDKKGKCVVAFESNKRCSTAEKQFGKLKNK